MTDNTSYSPKLEFGCTPTAWGFYPDRITHSVWSAPFLIVRSLYRMDTLFSNSVPVNGICRCSCQGCTFLGHDIPIRGLWNIAPFPGCNFLNAVMASLCDVIAWGYIYTSQLQPYPPLPARTVRPVCYSTQGHYWLISPPVHLVWKR